MSIQNIGPHRVRHGNVMETAGIAELMRGDQADLIYSDPPWGMGNLNYWRTINEKMTGQKAQQAETLDAFLTQIYSIAARYLKSSGIFFLEYGVRWEEQVIQRGADHGFVHLGRAVPIYGSTNLPLHLHLFARSFRPLRTGYLQSIDGTKGWTTLLRATAEFGVPGGVVLDPCCGLGYSAKLAMHHGMNFRGNELNAARLASTIKRLEKGVARGV